MMILALPPTRMWPFGIARADDLNPYGIDLRCSQGNPGMISMIVMTMAGAHRAGDGKRNFIGEDLALRNGRDDAAPEFRIAEARDIADAADRAEGVDTRRRPWRCAERLLELGVS